jgi:putative protease
MRIISPVDHLGEVAELLVAGADELYGGYVPAAWGARFGLLASINQRTFAGAQIDSYADLQSIVEQVRVHGGRFSLTLNAPYYTDAQIPLLLDYVEEASAAGIDGVILADLGLLRKLRPRFPRLQMHASTLAHLVNSAAVAEYRDAGIDRVVLPRHLPLAEMASIIAASPGVRFDAFLLVGNCPNCEGLCSFHHSSPDRIWPCEIPYAIDPVAAASSALTSAIGRQGSWAKSNRRHGCGLCALPALREAGIDGLKLVGRGAPAAEKVRNVLLACEFIDLVDTEPDFDNYQKKALSAHLTRFGRDCSPNVCYYPELCPNGADLV